ncbi:MAG: amidase domain-containing protein [Clostridia bacterium]|nr:amidase domain-containing protein [Clostridia bacterium]
MLLTIPYNRQNAVAYARRWALSRNPLFANFSGIGGDCTNFVSQCLLAGSCTMNYTPDFGWYYISVQNRAAAWTGVEFLYEFLTRTEARVALSGNVGPFAREVGFDEAAIGDVIQLSDSQGDFYHTLIISEVTETDLLLCAHSNDALDRPLSTYNNTGERILHIEEVRVDYPSDICFEPLINAVSLP